MFISNNQKRQDQVSPIEEKRERDESAWLFAEAPAMLCLIGIDGCFRQLNAAWEQMLGFHKEELLGKSCLEWIHPEDRETTLAAAEKLMKDTDTVSWENRYRCKDGCYKSLRWSATVFNEDCMYAVARDMTQCNDLERQLRQQSQIINQIHDAVVSTDLNGQIAIWNNGAERLFGYRGSEAIGQHISFIYSKKQQDLLWQQLILPLQQKGTHEAEVKMLRRRKKSGAVKSRNFEWVQESDVANIAGEAGDREEFWAHLSMSVLRDTTGTVIGTIGYLMDITPRKRAEQALRESEERYRWLAENSTDLISRHTLNGKYLYASPACRKLLGYEPEDLIGLSPYDLFHPEDLAAIEKSHNSILTQPDIYTVSYRIRRQDGHYIWLETTNHTVRDPDTGQMQEIFCVSRDISDRISTQMRLQHLISSSPAVIYTCKPSADRAVTFISDNITSQLGYEPKAFLENPGFWLDRIHPEDADTVCASFAQLFEADRATYEYRFRDKDGHYRWMHDRMQLVRDAAGQPLEIIGSWQEIGDRKKAEEELAKERSLLRYLIDSIPDLISYKNTESVYIGCNQAFSTYTGISESELVGKTDRDLFPEAIAAFYQAQDREMLEIRVAQRNEEWTEYPDGRRVLLDTLKTPFFDAEGKLLGLIGVSRDLTSRKQAEETLIRSQTRDREKAEDLERALQELKSMQTQLVQTEKLSSLGQLVAGVAHEINNPVNFIYGNLIHVKDYTNELLELIRLYHQYYPIPVAEIQEHSKAIDLEFLIEDLPKLIGSMKLGTDRIREIVRSLRTFSRLDESHRKAVDIHEGIESTLLILHNRLKAKPERPAIEIRKEFEQIPLVECYPGQLNQVFMNIIANAIDALEEYNERRSRAEIKANPNTIAIRTEVVYRPLFTSNGNRPAAIDPQPVVVIRIRDNGPGISPESRAKLFDPFFTTKPIGKGTGLGLSISHQIIVEKHGGLLECTSSPGEGTEFTIEIPLITSPQ